MLLNIQWRFNNMEDVEREDLLAQQEAEETQQKSVFETLNSVNVNANTEKKNGLTYLSWAWAWAEVKKAYPEANYKVYETENGCIYWTDGRTCWVKTGVTINGLEHIEYLPVMDYKNQSIPVEKVTSFDVNKAIQRSLTKACARHGLGLYIYAGEDLPEQEKPAKATAKQQPNYEDFTLSEIFENFAKPAIVQATTGGELREIWDSYPQLHEFEDFRNSLTVRKHYLGIK